MRLFIRLLTLGLVLMWLSGCRASGNQRAPVDERNGGAKSAAGEERERTTKRSQGNLKKPRVDAATQIYIVQKGDTLYSIAFDNGVDYRELAEQNNIENPSAIQIGQQIKLLAAEESTSEKTHVEPRSSGGNISVAQPQKNQPKVIKLAYSEQAVAQIEKMQQEQGDVVVAKVPPVIVKQPLEAESTAPNVADDSMDWGMPTKGRLIAEYSESANRKGVDIAGAKGQAVMASAAGKVVYSGSGLRGYGKLVIIKHNKTYLSAYAHNEQILVKEGQTVSKGQKIAEMGNSDADQVKLHFEIRKFGKPVDPAKFINFSKS